VRSAAVSALRHCRVAALSNFFQPIQHLPHLLENRARRSRSGAGSCGREPRGEALPQMHHMLAGERPKRSAAAVKLFSSATTQKTNMLSRCLFIIKSKENPASINTHFGEAREGLEQDPAVVGDPGDRLSRPTRANEHR
jgi:hypothetical protein